MKIETLPKLGLLIEARESKDWWVQAGLVSPSPALKESKGGESTSPKSRTRSSSSLNPHFVTNKCCLQTFAEPIICVIEVTHYISFTFFSGSMQHMTLLVYISIFTWLLLKEFIRFISALGHG